jgi:hypothetical protein
MWQDVTPADMSKQYIYSPFSTSQDILPGHYLCPDLYIARIISLHGVPKTIVSDRGP